ncbi:MAG: hypothetical protein IJ197_00230 [Bacteroidaceae bacterium]|nr:hypothetical protein [Bacteroidaceae bacterium]
MTLTLPDRLPVIELLKVLERLEKEIKQLRLERTGQEVVTNDDGITQKND